MCAVHTATAVFFQGWSKVCQMLQLLASGSTGSNLTHKGVESKSLLCPHPCALLVGAAVPCKTRQILTRRFDGHTCGTPQQSPEGINRYTRPPLRSLLFLNHGR